jgi:hypothetical protein
MDCTQFLHGSLAGIAGVMVSNPFDKVKSQVQKARSFQQPVDIWKIILSQTFRSVNKGIVPASLGMAVEKAVVFGTYDRMMQCTEKYGITNMVAQNAISGGVAGFMTSFFVTPCEQVKVLLQTSCGARINWIPKNTLYENITYYYRGLKPVLSRETPGFAVYFPTYHWMKRRFVESNDWNTGTTFLSGATAGVVSWIPIYPQDTIKTIIQSNTTGNKQSMTDCMRAIVKYGGIRNLYKGFWLVPLRVIPLHGTVLTVWEWLQTRYKE